MTNANTKLVAMYEELGMSSEEIAINEGLDETAVKAILLSASQKYRQDIAAPTPDPESCKHITEEEEEALFQAAKYLALAGEQESSRGAMIRFLINEKKGRNDIQKLLKQTGGSINITLINEAIVKTREALKRVKDKKPLELVEKAA